MQVAKTSTYPVMCHFHFLLYHVITINVTDRQTDGQTRARMGGEAYEVYRPDSDKRVSFYTKDV